MKTMNLKRAMLMLMLLVMTLSAVTGGTIAWFTDSVESSANVISAGNLDVELYHQSKTVQNSTKVDKDTKLFTLPTLWEPGAVTWENLTVENAGNLHMYYTLAINVANENYVTDTNYGLSSALKVAVVDEAISTAATREEVLEKATNGTALTTTKLTGTLAPETNDTKTYGVIIYWEPSADDNNWNVNNGKTVTEFKNAPATALQIELGVKLEATQLDAESDAFGPEYDENAKFTVRTAADLQEALNKGGKVILANDIAVDNYVTIPEGKVVTLDLGGNTLSSSTGTVIRNEGSMELVGSGTVESSAAAYAIRVQKGEVTIDSADINVKGAFGAVSIFNGANVTINGGNYMADGINGMTSHTVYVSGSTLTIKGGTFDSGYSSEGIDTICGSNSTVILNDGTFYASELGASFFLKGVTAINGGTYQYKPNAELIPDGYTATQNNNGTWTVDREYMQVGTSSATAADNGKALADAINATTGNSFLNLSAGEYKMPSIGGNKEVTIVGTKNTVIDLTTSAYMDQSTVAFEGVTIKGRTGTGGASDEIAFYSPNVTYTNCTFDGPFHVGRDGATFINCTFINLGNDYVWSNGNDVTFKGCTFNTDGKALLLYSHGGSEVAKVVVEDCIFNATQGAKAGAIANQNCAAIEIHNYGNGVNLTTSGNTIDSDFSGEWRIKDYVSGRPAVIVNGVTYTTIALDGKTMTKDANNNVTVNN